MTQAHRVQRQRRRGQQGFTLIELLVVIAVLGVLAGIVIFNVAGVANRGNHAACDTDRSTVQAAIDSYKSDSTTGGGSSGTFPNGAINFSLLTTAQSFGGPYLHTTPTACASYTYSDPNVSTTYKP